jgi:hypothetical protein
MKVDEANAYIGIVASGKNIFLPQWKTGFTLFMYVWHVYGKQYYDIRQFQIYLIVDVPLEGGKPVVSNIPLRLPSSYIPDQRKVTNRIA